MPLKAYSNTDGRSSIEAYEDGEDFIRIEFNTGRIYLYTEESCGETTVNIMKELAEEGRGLVSYINKYKPDYAQREK